MTLLQASVMPDTSSSVGAGGSAQTPAGSLMPEADGTKVDMDVSGDPETSDQNGKTGTNLVRTSSNDCYPVAC